MEGLPPGGLAVDEIFTNKRSKIFTLLHRMGIEAVAAGLRRAEDRVTLVTVGDYLRLKRGEVWTEIEMELQRDGLQPVETDAELLAHMHTVHRQLAERIHDQQRRILHEEQQRELTEETSTYASIVALPRQPTE